jgi:DNA-binding beta-propeller fold protein YncE
MRCILLSAVFVIAVLPSIGWAQQANGPGPYHVINTARVGGDGGWDYVYADIPDRRLYIPRSGQGSTGRITVFDLDTLKPVGEIPGFRAHGVAVDARSHHAFATSKPVAMWDTRTLKLIKTIDVQGNPDGILFDPFNERVYIFSHVAPNATVIDASNGSVVGTIDLGGAPEQAVTDGQGHIYVDLENKDQVAVVDAKTMTVTARYGLGGKGGGPGGLALDMKNHVLFVACHDPATMVILNARDGKIITALPIGAGNDGATFNPNTMEAFSSQGDGTLTVIKESNPTKFAVEQTVQTQPGARTLTLDTKSDKIFVITAKFKPAPPSSTPPPQGRRERRGPMVAGSFSILAVGK